MSRHRAAGAPCRDVDVVHASRLLCGTPKTGAKATVSPAGAGVALWHTSDVDTARQAAISTPTDNCIVLDPETQPFVAYLSDDCASAANGRRTCCHTSEMVLLTMTPSIVDGLRKVEAEQDEGRRAVAHTEDASAAASSEPPLEDPAVGKPISHGQIVDLWQKLRPSSSLEQLLQGARVYIPPPPPKPEPSDEYKALMARLRREEAARAYERMVNPPLRYETFDQRFPHAAQSFAEANRVTNKADLGDDEVTYNEVHRQVMLIINFLASILGVAATLWVTARWWGLPARIFLTLGGSIVVAVAEVGVYQGYVWRMGQAKTKQKAVREVKEVVQTWVVGQEEKTGEEPLLLKTKDEDADGGVRKRATAAAKPDT